MTKDKKKQKTLKFRQSKGVNSYLTNDTPVKLHVHNNIIVMYIHFKFDEIPSLKRQSKDKNSAIINDF